MRKKFDTVMHWMFPNWWVPLYTTVTFSRMRYHLCIENKKWQDRVSFDEKLNSFHLRKRSKSSDGRQTCLDLKRRRNRHGSSRRVQLPRCSTPVKVLKSQSSVAHSLFSLKNPQVK